MNIGINRESNARLLDSRLFNRNRIQYDCDVTSDGFSSLVYRGDVSRVPSYLPHSRYFPFLREELNQIFSTHRPMDCVGEDVLAKADLFFPIGQILSDSEARRCIRPSGTVNRRIRETSRDYSWFPFFFFFFFLHRCSRSYGLTCWTTCISACWCIYFSTWLCGTPPRWVEVINFLRNLFTIFPFRVFIVENINFSLFSILELSFEVTENEYYIFVVFYGTGKYIL